MAHAQQTLASYAGEKRVLLVFAPTDKDPLYQQQLSLLARHAKEMNQQDLVVLTVPVDAGPPITPETLRVTLGPGLPEVEQMLARRRFHIAPEAFEVVLLGKNGQERFRSDQPVGMDRLDRILDALPTSR
jgi:hypothetical protein